MKRLLIYTFTVVFMMTLSGCFSATDRDSEQITDFRPAGQMEIHEIKPRETEKDINSFVEDLKAKEMQSDLMDFRSLVEVADRIASYGLVYAEGGKESRHTSYSDEIEPLQGYLGEVYQSGRVCDYLRSEEPAEVYDWYLPVGSCNLKYLIREASDGTLSLWSFRSFIAKDLAMPDDIKEEHRTEYEMAIQSEQAFYTQYFPDTQRTSYTYGEVFRLIYGIGSAEDIESFTAHPSERNNTPLGKQIKQEVGTHTYTDRSDIETLYDATEELYLYGEHSWDGPYKEYYRFTYSFSTEADDKISSGECSYGERYLTISLKDGTTIDSMKYCAIRGRFFEYYGILSDPLPEDVVFAINDIFEIK